MKKIAAITGITGQDGSYLAELLLSKGYEVHGLRRRSSSFNTGRVDHLYQDPHEGNNNFFLHYGDLSDSTSLIRFLRDVRPHEIYNLAAQSHVAVSFETPEYTADVGALGTLRILEAIRTNDLARSTRFYQASTSELYGGQRKTSFSENSEFIPRSPYAAAKLYAYWITSNYREAYEMHASNGILFNHESPRRGETFVTRKITRGLSRISLGLQGKLLLGNLNASRDWGHAKDYVYAMWLMVQSEQAKDYVVATGQSYTVREFVNTSAKYLNINLEWEGEGLNEKAFDQHGNVVIEIDPEYYRPTEVNDLLGDASKIKNELGWTPKITFQELVEEMCQHDLALALKEKNRE